MNADVEMDLGGSGDMELPLEGVFDFDLEESVGLSESEMELGSEDQWDEDQTGYYLWRISGTRLKNKNCIQTTRARWMKSGLS